jgi:hypothetical protein
LLQHSSVTNQKAALTATTAQSDGVEVGCANSGTCRQREAQQPQRVKTAAAVENLHKRLLQRMRHRVDAVADAIRKTDSSAQRHHSTISIAVAEVCTHSGTCRQREAKQQQRVNLAAAVQNLHKK